MSTSSTITSGWVSSTAMSASAPSAAVVTS
jgi:hypothetical protein